MSLDDGAVYDARLELVDFVIEVFWNVPAEEFIEDLIAGTVQLPDRTVDEDLDAGFDHLSAFVAANEGRRAAVVYDEVRQEYTRIFVGPRPPVLAHETYYREDTDFLGQGLAEVEASYAAAGWSPPEAYTEESDFIAVELAFLRDLIDRQRAGQEETFGYERVFLDEHLGEWVDPFVEAVLDETDHDLFRAGALVLRGLVSFEDELVAQMVPGGS